MGKKFGMSNLGYAIVLVIIVGIIMIISAPMIVTNIKDKDGNPNNICLLYTSPSPRDA